MAGIPTSTQPKYSRFLWDASDHNSTTGFGYSAYFNPIITDGHGGEELRFSLSQVGTVPSGASELITKGNGFVYINDLFLSKRPTENFNEEAWDVSQFAGQEVKLEVRSYGDIGVGQLDLDIIGFSVPEPSEWALLILGGGMLWWTGRRVAKGK